MDSATRQIRAHHTIIYSVITTWPAECIRWQLVVCTTIAEQQQQHIEFIFKLHLIWVRRARAAPYMPCFYGAIVSSYIFFVVVVVVVVFAL